MARKSNGLDEADGKGRPAGKDRPSDEVSKREPWEVDSEDDGQSSEVTSAFEDFDVQIKKAEADGNMPLVAALKQLKAKGIDKNTILGLGSSYSGPEQRWWQCPNCKLYVDALLSVQGGPERLQWEDNLACPDCGVKGEDFDTVQGNYFIPNRKDEEGNLTITSKKKAVAAEGLHKSILTSLRDAKAAVASLGLFHVDPQFDKEEPRWPQDMSAIILGTGAYIGQMIHRLTTIMLRMTEQEDRRRGNSRERRPK